MLYKFQYNQGIHYKVTRIPVSGTEQKWQQRKTALKFDKENQNKVNQISSQNQYNLRFKIHLQQTRHPLFSPWNKGDWISSKILILTLFWHFWKQVSGL